MHFPTAYFPNLEYFYLLLAEKKAVISTGELFRRQTFRNRCVIMNANGLQTLSVPVDRNAELTRDIRISYAENWQKIHLRSIESAYRRTPYYDYYIDSIESILSRKIELLADLNFELTRWLADRIGLSVGLSCDSQQVPDPEKLNLSDPKKGSGFQTYPYIQTFGERLGFQNNLSIIDLLFNEGPNTICILKESGYEASRNPGADRFPG